MKEQYVFLSALVWAALVATAAVAAPSPATTPFSISKLLAAVDVLYKEGEGASLVVPASDIHHRQGHIISKERDASLRKLRIKKEKDGPLDLPNLEDPLDTTEDPVSALGGDPRRKPYRSTRVPSFASNSRMASSSR